MDREKNQSEADVVRSERECDDVREIVYTRDLFQGDGICASLWSIVSCSAPVFACQEKISDMACARGDGVVCICVRCFFNHRVVPPGLWVL